MCSTTVRYDRIDPGVRAAVEALRSQSVETFESCEGGPGHAYPEPTVRFYGESGEGFRAYAVALNQGLLVDAVRRVWVSVSGELTGPYWEMTFHSRGRSEDEIS